MNLYESIINNLKEDEDWEDSSIWKDKKVVANMPKFNAGIEKILNDLYDSGYVTYFNYLEATLHFSAYAEDAEYTIPENYSTLKDQLIKCATENNFVIDENSFSAEVTDGGEFDPELCSWDVVFKFTPIKNKIKESDVSPRDAKDYKEIFELRKQVDPRVADIIDCWTSSKAKSATAGNRKWYYNCFKKTGDNTHSEYIWKNVIRAFDDNIVNTIEAVSNNTFPYDGGREPGFLMIYDDNILEVCIYNSGVYSDSTNMEVMLHNDFAPSGTTFIRKSLSNEGKITEQELQKSILPVPEDTLTQKMKDIIMQEDPEQLKLDLSDNAVKESEEGKARAEKVVSSFSSNPTKGDFYKALNEISRLENDNEIDKDEYDEYIKKIQDAYNNRPR